MSRRKQSPLEDLIDIASFFPWWAGLSLGLISFIVLHYFASAEIQPSHDMSQMGTQMSKQMYISFAKIGQIIVPVICVFGALISAIKQKKREKIFSYVENYQPYEKSIPKQASIDPIDNMSWKEFEMLISEFFRRQGYSVVENNGAGPDGGVDLRISKDSKIILVQCKHWKTFKVGVNIVREQLGIKTAERADGVIIVTSGSFTDEAMDFANQQNISLIDGSDLHAIISRTKEEIPVKLAHSSTTKICPLCSSPMVERTARKGVNAGNKFWGCSQYPKCKGIISK